MHQHHNKTPPDAQLPPDLAAFAAEVTPEDLAAFSGAENERPHRPEAFTPPQHEIQGDRDDSFVGSLRSIRQEFHFPEHGSVVYPGSSTHVGVARVFGKDAVTHVDPDEGACEVLRGHGYRAESARIEDYVPAEPFDCMVALNSYGRVSKDTLEKLVRAGGYVVANNHTGWAHDLHKLGDTVELVGAVLPSYGDDSARLHRGKDIPPDATEVITRYYRDLPGGGIEPGTIEDHTFTDEGARYPAGLFIFQRKSPASQ